MPEYGEGCKKKVEGRETKVTPPDGVSAKNLDISNAERMQALNSK